MVQNKNEVGKQSRIVYEDVEETLNIPYVNREEVPLAMDIFSSKAAEAAKLPVIVFFHGGGFAVGDRGITRPFCRLLAHKGYLVFSVECRPAPGTTICQKLNDVCAGLELVEKKLAEYPADMDRVFLTAESAGAYPAVYAAAMQESEKLQHAIGYQASKLRFRALGLMSGIYYSDRSNSLGRGETSTDKHFLKYLNPEHPEIINHLPPVFFTTSSGDFMSSDAFLFHNAMKKTGKNTHLIYYADNSLGHAYNVLQPEHPKSMESLDKMLAWFDEQAALQVRQRQLSPAAEKKLRQIEARMQDGSINEQKIWKYVKECNSYDEKHLNAVAVIDCTREYTYRQMFTEWERYARAFSGLNICSSNHSRAAICGAICAEPLFAFYALNMTGVTVSMLSFPDFLPAGNWKGILKREKITDLIISDIMVTPQLWQEISAAREELGLRNVILVHSLLGGPGVGPGELFYNEFNYHALRRIPGTVFMSDLLETYKDTPIRYCRMNGNSIAVITHTSGTTKGVRKPLPYTDRAVNIKTSKQKSALQQMTRTGGSKQLRVLLEFDFSSYLILCGLTNGSLANGDTVILTCFGFLHPKFIKAVDYYNGSILNASGFMIDKWIERTDLEDLDLSAVKLIMIGGSYMSPEKVKRYEAFFKAHGYRHDIVRGYGMSEAGSAQIIVPPGNEEDILGYPGNKDDFMIRDEDDGKFYTLDEGPRTGIMYIASDSLCCNELDGEVLFDFTVINGKNFLCTNDMIRLNENGSFAYAGRSDKYFANNEGMHFDSGIVEVQMSAHPAINMCAVVPVLEKRIHDTVPVLYVVPSGERANAAEEIRKALVDVYITKQKISDTNLPVQFVLVDSIPCNSNGKIDIFRITRERLKGHAYNILPVRENGKLTDIKIEYTEQLSGMTGGTLPEGMDGNSAFNFFDVFNCAPSKGSASEERGMFRSLKAFAAPLWFKDGRMLQLPGSLRQPMVRLMYQLRGSKDFGRDIEE